MPIQPPQAVKPRRRVATRPEIQEAVVLPRVESKRAHNKQNNRARIMAAAKQCFLEHGYDAVTIRDVVRQSGLAAGTFYNYFNDKDVLFRAVLEARIAEVSAAMRKARMQSDSVDRFTYSAFYALFSMAMEDPSFFHLVLRNEHAVRTLFDDSVMGVPMRELVADLHEFVARGIFPKLDVPLLAAAFYGVGFEISRYLALQPNVDAAATARFATDLMTGGIKAFGVHDLRTKRVRRGEVSVQGTLP